MEVLKNLAEISTRFTDETGDVIVFGFWYLEDGKTLCCEWNTEDYKFRGWMEDIQNTEDFFNQLKKQLADKKKETRNNGRK